MRFNHSSQWQMLLNSLSLGGVDRALVKESEDLGSISDWLCDFGFPVGKMRVIYSAHVTEIL